MYKRQALEREKASLQADLAATKSNEASAQQTGVVTPSSAPPAPAPAPAPAPSSVFDQAMYRRISAAHDSAAFNWATEIQGKGKVGTSLSLWSDVHAEPIDQSPLNWANQAGEGAGRAVERLGSMSDAPGYGEGGPASVGSRTQAERDFYERDAYARRVVGSVVPNLPDGTRAADVVKRDAYGRERAERKGDQFNWATASEGKGKVGDIRASGSDAPGYHVTDSTPMG